MTSRLRLYRDHIIHDLDPYVCLFEGCEEDEDIFTTRSDWIAHMRSRHVLEWRCNARQHQQIFKSSAAMEHHLITEHNKGSFPKDLLNQLVDFCQYTSGPIFENCSFCHFKSDDLDDHVEAHLRSLASQSLPNLDTRESASSQSEIESLSIAGDRSIPHDKVCAAPGIGIPSFKSSILYLLWFDAKWVVRAV